MLCFNRNALITLQKLKQLIVLSLHNSTNMREAYSGDWDNSTDEYLQLHNSCRRMDNLRELGIEVDHYTVIYAARETVMCILLDWCVCLCVCLSLWLSVCKLICLAFLFHANKNVRIASTIKRANQLKGFLHRGSRFHAPSTWSVCCHHQRSWWTICMQIL